VQVVSLAAPDVPAERLATDLVSVRHVGANAPTGGLLLLLIALELLTGRSEEPSHSNEAVNVALLVLHVAVFGGRRR